MGAATDTISFHPHPILLPATSRCLHQKHDEPTNLLRPAEGGVPASCVGGQRNAVEALIRLPACGRSPIRKFITKR